MQQNFTSSYITTISERFKRGTATEHTYRGDLQKLIEALVKDVVATNEPKRQACGAPDYIITRNDIPIGYIEAKDIGDIDLLGAKKTGNKEQFDRYKASLSNLIFTDYLDFHFYKDGVFVTSIRIGEIIHLPNKGGNTLFYNEIIPKPENFEQFTKLLINFTQTITQTITSAEKLAQMMAGKARMMELVLEKALIQDQEDELNPDTTLQQQFNAFKDILIHDIKPNEFADIYAQTIAYGMFAARLHDTTLDSFTRKEAAELIPKSNPFLRRLFQYIAGYDLDDRLAWIVDALADVFRATDVKAILKNFGKNTQMNDPIIHFYETFLSEYNPALRKSRGVWYTPAPVVNFIVRAVDDILKTEFNLKDGLASTETTEIKVNVQHKKEKGIEKVHKVQILDPAAGTGTFLSEVVKQIYKKFEGQEGIWNNYVEKNLIPRLNGFEILMASYAMCHLQLELLLAETGYTANDNKRLRVYLTNSLEEAVKTQQTLFAEWLSNEAIEANSVKRDTPVMVVLGNPPYSGESSNKGEWIMNIMEDYKKEPGGKEKLKERNPKWINDDYVKFLRYAQYFIEKNGEGVVAFINPHGFLDNPTFRGMRWNLLKTYDKIYTIDLHGNSKKKEVCPDGSPDVNVFDIMQGVSINLFIKTGTKKNNELGKVFHYDLYGKRELKYDFLLKNSLKTIPYKELPNVAPNYFFVQKNFEEQNIYDYGFTVSELFIVNNVGIATAKDSILINETKVDLIKNVNENYKINSDINLVQKITYRPFDEKNVYYDTKIIERAREKVMQHFIKGENLGLIIGRQGQVVGSMQWNLSFITKNITDLNIYYRGGGAIFPLYLYPEKTEQTSFEQKGIRMEIPSKETPSFRFKLTPLFRSKLTPVFRSKLTPAFLV